MMSAPWRETIDELLRRKLRTLLTMLGMIFGVGAIVAMQGIGEGSRREALKLVEGLGLHNLIVEAKSQDGDALKEARTRSMGLTIADARAALDVVPSAQRYAADKQVKSWSIFSAAGHADAYVTGVSPGYFQLASLRIADGRDMNSNDDADLAAVAVLGHQVAHELFPDGHAVGQLMKVNHVWLRVIGVLADRDLGQDKFEGVALADDSNRVFVPLASARARFRFQPMEDDIDRFVVQLADPERLAMGAKVLTGLLDQRHADVSDYRLIVPQQLYQQNQKTQHIFSVVMGSIAGVSLLVGGIGIMNIMLANVLERRREIGLLRAIGARRHDIITLFLQEALLICGAGALLGLLFGAALAYAIATFAGWKVAWAPLAVMASMLACVLIGVAFSIYPARQAAALDPIAAIRDE
jgi:putative ABC transport system permease protein